MQGLPIDEKMLLIRMGELIDNAINNRTPTNPNAQKGHRKNRVIQATSLSSDISARGSVLRWDKVDSSDLLQYKIRILAQDGTGTEIDAIAYTNQFLFKGKAGDYKFNISVVNRNSQAGGWSADHLFQIPDTPMILEGNKLGVEELGPQVFETVLTPLNYTVFAFASLVLDTLSDPNSNPAVTVKLSYGETYDASVFVEEFDMYPESEDLCNFDATQGVTRPAGTPTRSGTFQTTQSVMFTPFQILEDSGIEDLNTKFWITVTNHSNDVVGLSCAIWVASEGLSEETTGVTTEEQHKFSVNLGTTTVGLDRAFGYIESSSAEDASINNIWTFAAWIKPQAFSPAFRILHMSEWTIGGINTTTSRKLMNINYDTTPRLNVQVTNNDNTVTLTWIKNGQANIWPLGLNQWHFLVVSFYGTRAGSKISVYVNGSQITSPTFDDSNTDVILPYTLGNSPPVTRIISIGSRPDTSWTSGTAVLFDNDPMNASVHQAGLWSVVLSSSAISALYNSGHGSFRDWRFSSGAYGNQLDLQHYWRFGALNNSFTGPSDGHWIKSGGGQPTQAQVNINVANDVSFDLGRSGEPALGQPYDFTNQIQVNAPSNNDRGWTKTDIGGAPGLTFGFHQPNATDIVADYPA